MKVKFYIALNLKQNHMQASELRIGNWVYFLSKKNEHKISRLDFQVWKIDKFNYFTPIPITEDWLIRFGFEYDSWDVWFKLNNPLGYSIAIQDFKKVFYFGENEKMWVDIHKSCESVHQLQNLYFALTGEELNNQS